MTSYSNSSVLRLGLLRESRKNRIELVGRPFKKAMHADAKIAYHRDTGGNNSKYGMVDTLRNLPALGGKCARDERNHGGNIPLDPSELAHCKNSQSSTITF